MKLETLALHYWPEVEEIAKGEKGDPLNDTRLLEKRLAAMEGASDAQAVASGSTALRHCVELLCDQGDNLVSVSQLKGESLHYFTQGMKKLSIEARLVSHNDYAALELSIDKRTKAIYCETLGNPAGNIVDIEKLATIAHRHGLPLIVDNSLTTPVLCRPVDFGADIILHDLRNFVVGDASLNGGMIIDAGKFDWQAHPNRFAKFSRTEIPSGKSLFIHLCKQNLSPDRGALLAPASIPKILQSLETLSLRMHKHCENANLVAQALLEHPRISWVNYAALRNSPFNPSCEKITKGLASGLLSFGIKGGEDAAPYLRDALKLIAHGSADGGRRSIVCHPLSTSHNWLSEGEYEKSGVSPDLISLNIGLEHIDDIVADLTQALDSLPAEAVFNQMQEEKLAAKQLKKEAQGAEEKSETPVAQEKHDPAQPSTDEVTRPASTTKTKDDASEKKPDISVASESEPADKTDKSEEWNVIILGSSAVKPADNIANEESETAKNDLADQTGEKATSRAEKPGFEPDAKAETAQTEQSPSTMAEKISPEKGSNAEEQTKVISATDPSRPVQRGYRPPAAMARKPEKAGFWRWLLGLD